MKGLSGGTDPSGLRFRAARCDIRAVAWNDAGLKIDWQLDGEPVVSAKDQRGVPFHDAEKFD